ncbi:MAG TPA: AAA family ATPase [Clostridiales bacterium]|nr:AAA family ATPase [Clostridiales bacterium]
MMINEADITKFSVQCKGIFEQIERDVIGQKEVIEGTVIAMIAGGNVLLEGVPGVGKTRLVRSLGRVFNLPFSRIQFTPDLMPADVTGTNIVVKGADGNTNFTFQPGPIFSNIILADEINRATPKTQSALLEAMQEHTVTVMGVSRKLNEPFFVLATQNPIEQDGTYPLPEAQMDRFMFKIIVKNPTLDELMDIVNLTQKTMAEVADAACSGEQLLEMRKTANQIPVAEEVMRYAMTLCSATHPDSDCATETAKKYVRLGASPRAGQALISAAKVRALLLGRFNVSYDDINRLAYPVLRHRMKLTFEAIAERVNPDDIIKMIIEELSKKHRLGTDGKAAKATDAASDQAAQADTSEDSVTEERETGDVQDKKSKRKFFGRK